MNHLHSLAAVLLLALPLVAAENELVERRVTDPQTNVEVRTYQENGKTITERITTTRTSEKEVRTPVVSTRKAAIFVADRSNDGLGDSTLALQDAIAAQLSNAGFSLVSTDIATEAVSTLQGGSKTAIDQALADNTSALRLAQSLNVDYIVFASFLGAGQERRRVTTYGVDYETITSNLRVAYRILDANAGGSLLGDTITVSKDFRQSENASTVSNDVLNGLLADAGKKVADSVTARVATQSLSAPAAAADLANVSISVEAADLEFPEFSIDDKKQVSISGRRLKLTPTSVTVEIDGLAIGNAPGSFKLRPGIHKIRLTRDGFKDWAKTINIYEGQKLSVAMEMSEAGFERWKESAAFVQGLKDGAKLNDAEAEKLRGIAEFFRNSKMQLEQLNTTTNVLLGR